MSGWTEEMLRVEVETRMLYALECDLFEVLEQKEDQRQAKLERAERSTPEVWTTMTRSYTPMECLQ